MPKRETVEIPKAWLAFLAGGLLVALLLVAYLVGRESGRRAFEAARVGPPVAEADAGYQDDGDYADGEYEDEYPEDAAVGYDDPLPPAGGFSPGTEPHDPWSRSLEPTPPAARAEAAPGADPRAAAVAAYFTELEGYERGAKYWSNPQELAMRLVGQGTQGDTSGFRQLVETQRTAQRQIEAMTVPSPCREHHRRTLEVMRQAVELLEQLERGVASGNLEGLLSMTGESRQLETEAREVDALAAELKRRYGV